MHIWGVKMIINIYESKKKTFSRIGSLGAVCWCERICIRMGENNDLLW